MKKKSIIMILSMITFVVIFLISPYVGKWLFSSQYNNKGVSHFLVVTKDENQPKKYIGKLNNHRIVSIAEWKKYAWKIEKNGDAEVLKYDNYEIACAYDDCIIRPLSK